MKNEAIFKTIGLAVMVIGTFAIGSYAWAWHKKNKDEKEIDETLAATDALAQNFSGAGGPERPRFINRPTNPIAARRSVGKSLDFYTDNGGGSGERRIYTTTTPGLCFSYINGVATQVDCEQKLYH